MELEQKFQIASPKQQQRERTLQCWQEKAYLWSQQAESWAHSYLRVWLLMDASSHLEAFMLWNLPAETNMFWVICTFWQKTTKQTNQENPTRFSPAHKPRLIRSITLALPHCTSPLRTDFLSFLSSWPQNQRMILWLCTAKGGENSYLSFSDMNSSYCRTVGNFSNPLTTLNEVLKVVNKNFTSDHSLLKNLLLSQTLLKVTCAFTDK